MTPIADRTAVPPPADPEVDPEVDPVGASTPDEPDPGEAEALSRHPAVDEPPEGTSEPVDAVPVLAEARTLTPAIGALPAVQAAAVAATGFVAGAATLALVRRHTARRLARARPVRGRAIDMLPVVGSRTFVVDVHLLAKPGE